MAKCSSEIYIKLSSLFLVSSWWVSSTGINCLQYICTGRCGL